MHLKTGTINGVKGLAGYVKGLSGKEYTVVFMHNDFSEFTYKNETVSRCLFNLGCARPQMVVYKD